MFCVGLLRTERQRSDRLKVTLAPGARVSADSSAFSQLGMDRSICSESGALPVLKIYTVCCITCFGPVSESTRTGSSASTCGALATGARALDATRACPP